MVAHSKRHQRRMMRSVATSRVGQLLCELSVNKQKPEYVSLTTETTHLLVHVVNPSPDKG